MSALQDSRLAPLPVAEQQARFREIITDALAHARSLGASDAVAEVAEGQGLSLSVRRQSLETVEQTRDRSLSITVFAGTRRGAASTSDLSPQAVRETVAAAWDIARYTAEDPAAGLPDESQLATDIRDLDLHHPWLISADEGVEIACRAEQAALETSRAITNTEGASLDVHEGHFIIGNTRGLLAGYPYSRHSFSVSPIAGRGEAMQRDYWYTAARAPAQLASPEAVGRYAAERTLSRLAARRIPTGKYPVLFEAPLAVGLLGALAQAASGGALYRQASFLIDHLGRQILPEHIDVREDPFIPRAMGSSPFDAEGVRVQARDVVTDGVLQGYFLSVYTARKLGMQTTGNAGGSHNLWWRSRLAYPQDDLPSMLRRMGTGLLVTELIGQGVNYVTGDYSRGAFGYWVENGQIQHAVEEITIAGNLAEMFQQVVAIGTDVCTRGGKSSGSVLIEQMAVAGS